METTEPINGDDIGAIADNLIMNAPTNSDEATDEVVDQVVDEQPETIEAEAEGQDDVDTLSDDDELEFDDDVTDIGVEEPDGEQEPVYSVKVDGKEKQVSLEELKRGYWGKSISKGHGRKRGSPKGSRNLNSRLPIKSANRLLRNANSCKR